MSLEAIFDRDKLGSLTVSAFSMDLEAAKNLKKPEPIIFVEM